MQPNGRQTTNVSAQTSLVAPRLEIVVRASKLFRTAIAGSVADTPDRMS